MGEEQGASFPLPTRPPFHRAKPLGLRQGRTNPRGDRRHPTAVHSPGPGAPGDGSDAATQPQAPGWTARCAPGAPRKAEAETHSHATPVGPDARRGGGAALPTAGRARPRGQSRREGERGASAASKGRVPHPCPPRSTRRGWGGRARGPRTEREERHIRHERPSLAWRSLGPAQESARSPHRSHTQEDDDTDKDARLGGGPARTAYREEPAFSLTSPAPPAPEARAAHDDPGGTPDTQRHGATHGTVVTHRSRCPPRGAHGDRGPPPPPPSPSLGRQRPERRWHLARGTLGCPRAGARAQADGSSATGPPGTNGGAARPRAL